MAAHGVVGSGVIINSIQIWHGYATSDDTRRGGHLGALTDNQQPGAQVTSGAAVPGRGNPAYMAWNAPQRLCCIYSDGGVSCGPGTPYPNGCPNGPGVPGNHLVLKKKDGTPKTLDKTLIGAHVYDSDVNGDSALECLIIPTCDFHNNHAGNEGRGQNWGGTGVPQTVKHGTPFIVRRIRAAVVAPTGVKGQAGQNRGHTPFNLGPWNPANLPAFYTRFPGVQADFIQ